jgi:hypothetical protein
MATGATKSVGSGGAPTTGSVRAPDDLSGFKSTTYDAAIRQAAEKYNVPARLIKAVIQQESGFNPNATSPTGAKGLMQLMPATARAMGITNPNDPAQNIDGGTKYLAGMLHKFNGNVELALAAYNAGPTRVAKYNAVPPITETQNYVRNIMANYNGQGRVSLAADQSSQERVGRTLVQRPGMADGGTYPPVYASDAVFYDDAAGAAAEKGAIEFDLSRGAQQDALVTHLLDELRTQYPIFKDLSDEELVGLARAINPDLDQLLSGPPEKTDRATLVRMPEAAVVLPKGGSRAELEAAIVAAARASPAGPRLAALKDSEVLKAALDQNPELKVALASPRTSDTVVPLTVLPPPPQRHVGWFQRHAHMGQWRLPK